MFLTFGQQSKAVLIASLLVGHVVSNTVLPRSGQCISDDGLDRTCYGDTFYDDQGNLLHIDKTDLANVAIWARKYGSTYYKNTPKTPYWSIAAGDGCIDDTVYTCGSLKLLVVHHDDSQNSAVLYEDIGNTIDGGNRTTRTNETIAASISSCGINGGSRGAVVDLTNPRYSVTNPQFGPPTNYTRNNIVVKVIPYKSEVPCPAERDV